MFITLRLLFHAFIFYVLVFCERARVRVINWRAPNVHVSLQFTRSRIDMNTRERAKRASAPETHIFMPQNCDISV